MNHFEKVMNEMKTQMSILCQTPVDGTPDGMCGARAMVYDRGDYDDNAKADMILYRWMWAHCEEEYHSMKADDGK